MRAPPAPVLHAKQDRLSAQKCKKKQSETETLIHTDTKNTNKAPTVVQGTQNAKIKEAQPSTQVVKKNEPEKESLVMPNQEINRHRSADVREYKTETKSNVPWYLQD